MAESLGIGTPIAAAGPVDHRLHPGAAIASVAPRGDNSPGESARAAPPTQLDIGTVVEAVLRALPPAGTPDALGIGTHLLLRIVTLPSAPTPGLLIGRIGDGGGGGETLVETAIGLLALLRRLALKPGTIIAFERLGEIAPATSAQDAPSRVGGWPALDETLTVLAQAAPALAAAIQSELMPGSGTQLAGTLLFLLGALYHGNWPGPAVAAALKGAGQANLAQRLAEDTVELRRLGADPATGDWRVLTLPVLAGVTTLPLRVFTRRREPGAPAEDGTRFAIEVELSPLGPLQLDGLLRGVKLSLVLRSHRDLPPELRAQARAAFQRALAAMALVGDISFVTTAQFAVTPLSGLREHVKVSV